jgi:hypothetical protein
MAEIPNGNQAASLGLPGVLGSVIIGLLLLPPRPVDTIPVVNVPPDLNGRLQLQGLPDENRYVTRRQLIHLSR